MNWIKVKDRLPNKEGQFIVFRDAQIERRWYDGKDFLSNGEYYFETHRITNLITHWMPLPEPPAI